MSTDGPAAFRRAGLAVTDDGVRPALTFHLDDPTELLEQLQGLLAQMRKPQVFVVPDEAGVRAKYPTVESLNAAIEAKTKEI